MTCTMRAMSTRKVRKTITESSTGTHPIEQWALACGFRNWDEAAAALGISKSTMSETRRRATLDRQLLLAMTAIFHRHKPWNEL